MKFQVVNLAYYKGKKDRFIKDVIDPTVLILAWGFSVFGDVAMALRMEVVFARMFINFEIRKVPRSPGTSFTECITTFVSVYTHWQQLLRPVNHQDLSDISISTRKQITPFLVNDKCAKLFTSWVEQKAHYQSPVTKERILDIVDRFELQPDL